MLNKRTGRSLKNMLVVVLSLSVMFTMQAMNELFRGWPPVPLPVESACCTVEAWTLQFERTSAPLKSESACCPVEGWLDSGAVLVPFAATALDTVLYVSDALPFGRGQLIRIDHEQMLIVDVNVKARWVTVQRSVGAVMHEWSARVYVWGWECQHFKPFTPRSIS